MSDHVDEMPLTDSAERLYEILVCQSPTKGGSAGAVFAEFLQYPNDDFSQCKAYQAVVNLSFEVLSDAEGIPGWPQRKVDELSDPIRAVATALAGNGPKTPWQNLMRGISPDLLQSVKLASGPIMGYKAEIRLSDEHIDRLLGKISVLRDGINASSLPKDVMELLLEHLAKIQEALILHKVYGASGATAAIERAIGAASIAFDRGSAAERKSWMENAAAVRDWIVFLYDTFNVLVAVKANEPTILALGHKVAEAVNSLMPPSA